MLALKDTLTSHGISQAALARGIGLSTATIAQLLNHEQWPKSPDPTTLKRMVSGFLVDNGIAVDAAMFNATGVSPDLTTLTDEVMTMLLRKQSLSPAAKRHFSLFRDPFSDEISDADDVFNNPSIRHVREYLWVTAKLGGFVAVVGESGAGKSTLRQDLEDRIRREEAPIILIQPYVLGMEDNDKKGKTLKSSDISDAIIAAVAPNETPKSSTQAKSRQLHRVLRDSRRAGFSHCLIIEEAHALPIPTLKHLKRFFELQDGFKRLLSVVQIGQPELKNKLCEWSPEVREVVQRCELVELMPLDSDLEAYLRFKFSRVGIELDTIFEKAALDSIRERLIFTKHGKSARETVSLMYPLMINNLVTGAMNQAAELGIPKISADLVREA